MKRRKLLHLFCDEAGFTGNQLLDAEQEIFAYSAVAIEPAEAAELVKKIKADFRFQGVELKGGSLVGRPNGRKIVTEIVKACEGRYRVVAHLKPYALACKFFEYVFEPAVSNFNSFLYGIDFHRYIGTLLFTYFRAEDKSAEAILDDFMNFARRGDKTALEAIFPVTNESYKNNALATIGAFALLHRRAIEKEVLSFREPGVPNWILDLTTTSLFGLLTWWGERAQQLEVVCDESKPIKGDIQVFDAMVNRAERAYIRFQGKKQPMTFNLSSPLQMAKSQDHPGLQIADVLASATAYALRNSYRGTVTSETEEWRSMVSQNMIEDNIWPDLSYIDLSAPGCFANTIILQALVERSIKGEDLFDGLPQLYQVAYQSHKAFADDAGI